MAVESDQKKVVLNFQLVGSAPKLRQSKFKELLEYLAMLVLRPNNEALCAQLNNEGHVDACITSDSDAFLFGAKTVIKVPQSNCKEPFE